MKRYSFTLIELLVVIAIIGILASMSLTSLNVVRLKARDARVKSALVQIRNLVVSYADAGVGNYSDLNCSPTGTITCESFSTYSDERYKISQLADDIRTQLGTASGVDGLSIVATGNSYQAMSKLPSTINTPNNQDVFVVNTNGANANPAYADLVPSGILGYWPMDETSGSSVADSSGNNMVGTSTSSVNITTSGQKFGAAARTFNMTSDYVQLGSNSDLNITADYTISAWVKTTGTLNSLNTILGKYSSGTGYMLLINSSRALIMYASDGSTKTYSISNIYPNDTNWHHVAAVKMGGTARIYLDGVEKGSNTTSLPVTFMNPSAKAEIGGYYGANGLFNGQIDEARLYNRALSPAEIAVLANS